MDRLAPPTPAAPPIPPPRGGATLALGSHASLSTNLEAPPLGGELRGAHNLVSPPLGGGAGGASRDRAIDMAKGLGILCIVFLHYENGVIPWQMNLFIGSFMISMFYVTSGWLSAMKPAPPMRALAVKRLKTLGLPYLWWSLIILAFDTLLWACGHYDTYFVARETYKTLVLRGVGTLWFLPALYIGELVVNACRRCPRSVAAFVLTIALIFVYYRIYYAVFGDMRTNRDHIINGPFRTLCNGCGAVIGVAGGLAFHRLLAPRVLEGSRWMQGILAVALLAVGFYGATYMGRLGWWTGFLWPFVCPVCAPVGFILLFRALGTPRLLRYLDYWGRNSLALMVTHYDIVLVLLAMLLQLTTGHSLDGWWGIGAFIVSMPVQWVLAELLNRYCPRLLGKKKPADAPHVK